MRRDGPKAERNNSQRGLARACRLGIAISSLFALTACVAGGASIPKDLGSVLTPQQSTVAEKPIEPDTSLALADTGKTSPVERAIVNNNTAKTPKTAQPATKTKAATKTDVTTALRPVTPAASASDTAATQAKVNAPAKADAAKTTAIKPVSAPAPAQPAQKAKEKPKSLFAAIIAANKNGRKKAQKAKKRTATRARLTSRSAGSALPGVRKNRSIFAIDESNETEELDEPVRLAAVTNLARRGNHGLLLQRKGVQVGCFPPHLVRLLKTVERKFGRTPIVTSGFRSQRHNRMVRGARNSTHTRCLAADIQVQGVSKWTLAKYLRSLPGRGGVGTYCHTKSVHIDIGSKRAWHHCGRKRKRKKRA